MRLAPARQHVPILATAAVCALLYAATALAYPRFCSWPILVSLFSENAILGLTAVGMTFVILSGGIDLSVGAAVGFSSLLLASLLRDTAAPPLLLVPLVLAVGAAGGTAMGAVIHFFRLPPFLVTLAGMFLARGLAFVISLEAINIRHPLYDRLGDFGLDVFPVPALLFIAALLAALYLAHWTRFGRNVYALGGSEPSALLMGLPVARTKILVYALSGLCAAAAGVVYTLYTGSGSPNAGTMLELDAIAAVVIGGTLLSGGVGHVAGTLLGVLIYGIIQTAIIFHGQLSSWWTRIAIGVLLLAFILLQRLVQSRAAGRH